MSSNTAILDFDNTLFRTREFWHEVLFPALHEKYSTSKEKLEEIFRESTTGEVDYFIPEHFLTKFREHTGITNARELFEQVVYEPKAKEYLYEGALELIQNLKRAGRVIVLSYGDTAFKQRWFEACGLTAVLPNNAFMVTAQPKRKFLQTLPLSSNVLLINDILPETLEMLQVLEKRGVATHAILFCPPTSQVVSVPEHVEIVTSLTEIHV